MSTATSILRPGDTLGGFRVEDVIGIGGMAIVYRAEQISLGRQVALKVLSTKLTQDETFKERFRREGKHAAALEHPNIVPVYDSGEQDGALYLAMRLVEGTNLAELIQMRGVSADRMIELLRPIAGALDSAHAAGLIHRDVKPQNILITDDGHPYLADFGVAKGSNTLGLTATGGFLGSVNYASPEQIKGLTLTPASDIYALTAVLYHCLTGEVPYARETDAGIMHAHLTEPPPALPAISGAGNDLHTVLARGMAKDPGSRYGHAGDLINAAALAVSRMPSERRKAVPAFATGEEVEQQPATGAADPTAGRSAQAGAQPELKAPSATELLDGDRLEEIRSSAAMTAADRRRPEAPPPPATPEPKRSPRRGVLIALAAGAAAAIIAAVAILLASSGGSAGPARVAVLTASSGPITLSYRAPWRKVKASAAPDGVRLADPLALSRPHATLQAGALADGAPVPGGLPPGLAGRLAQAPTRTAVRLGSISAVEYSAPLKSGTTEMTLLVVPTAERDLGLVCSSAAGHALSNACLATVRSLRLHGVRPVGPGADPALARSLTGVLKTLAARRSHAQPGLASAHLARRAAAAGHAAQADTHAAATLARLSPQPRDRSAVRSLAGAVRQQARALRSLAAAAHALKRAAYASAAKTARSAGASVQAARIRLRRMGFAALPALPALPAPHPRHAPAPSSAPSTPTASEPVAPVTPSEPVAPVASPPPSSSPPARHSEEHAGHERSTEPAKPLTSGPSPSHEPKTERAKALH